MKDQLDISRHSGNAAHHAAAKDKAKGPLDAAACYALIGVCDVCGMVNAIDLDASEKSEREMQDVDRTVKRVTREEALEAWKGAGRCDHKSLVKSLRAQLSEHNETSAGTGATGPRLPGQ